MLAKLPLHQEGLNVSPLCAPIKPLSFILVFYKMYYDNLFTHLSIQLNSKQF